MEAIGGTDLSQYRDGYREAVEAVIRAKAEGVEPPEVEARAEPAGRVVDLMAALKDSVRVAREARGETAGAADVREMRPAKKTGKKAPAKKTARKRSAS